MSKKLIQAAAGAGGEPVYVEDVFATHLYTSTGSALTITNGLDLSGEGGLVWIKDRDAALNHVLIDTERGKDAQLYIDASGQITPGNRITAFNSNGFTLGTDSDVNTSSARDYCSWTFRKQAGFFDVITWTGDGSSTRTLSHDLNANIGAVLIKGLNENEGWIVAHRATSAGNKILQLNTTSAETTANHTYISGSTLTVGTAGNPSFSSNDSGINYVAYLFAHDDQSFGDDSDESIIKCGSFTTDGNAEFYENLGFEPQWVLVKRSDGTSAWNLLDNMRGFLAEGTANGKYLRPNTTGAEGNLSSSDSEYINATGFGANGNGVTGSANATFIYIAIRRPMKTPEAGTDVFAIDTRGSSSGEPNWKSGFVTDWAFITDVSQAANRLTSARLTQGKNLNLDGTGSESANSNYAFDYMNGFFSSTSVNSNFYGWLFKRATGAFDVVAYTGDGTSSGRNINHNLKAVPELMIVKCRSASDAWMVYSSAIGNTKYLSLNSTAAEATSSLRWNNTTPTDSVFTVGGSGTVNSNGETYISYLFATVAGVSKVGSYTGDGTSDSSHVIDCGFSAGARFVMIKRTDSTGDWWVFDTTRGLVAGADTRIALNSTSAQYTGIDDIDPHSSGFIVTNPGGSDLNVNNATYIFLAIA